MEMQVLYEKYATQHAIGIVSWFELDSKITEADKLLNEINAGKNKYMNMDLKQFFD